MLLTKNIYDFDSDSVLNYVLHQQIPFFTTFQNLIQRYLKKDFCHEYFLFNPLTMTEVFCPCSLSKVGLGASVLQFKHNFNLNQRFVFMHAFSIIYTIYHTSYRFCYLISLLLVQGSEVVYVWYMSSLQITMRLLYYRLGDLSCQNFASNIKQIQANQSAPTFL